MSGRAPTRNLASLLIVGLLAAPAFGDVVPLTLYQRVGRSPWIVFGEITKGEHRFVEIKVLEVLKGIYGREDLRLVWKLENFLRKSWEDGMVFKSGERAVFFLKRYETDREDGKLEDWMKAEDLFSPSFGVQGKFPMPEEGASAYLEAIREFVRVTGISDPVAREDAELGFLSSANPHILQAGLERVIDERLAGPAQVPGLLALSDSPRDSVRLNALQALLQVAEDSRSAGRKLENHQDVVNILKGKAMGEGGDLYRAEALKVVAALAGADERAFLERLSTDDRSQIVRYEAGRALLSLPTP